MLSVRLDENIENQLNFVSKEMHLSKSKIIKESLIFYFDMLKKERTNKTPFELGSELFGRFESGKENLSATYKQQLKEKINAKNAHR